jgi:hypothetical protein
MTASRTRRSGSRAFGPAVLAVASVSGCFVSTTEDPPPPSFSQGVLVLDWSIDGSQDPSLCRLSDADTINIAIHTSFGDFVGEYEQSCEAMATSIALYPTDYVAEAVLLDPTGVERTTPVNLGVFSIYANDQLGVSVDFPADSFY